MKLSLISALAASLMLVAFSNADAQVFTSGLDNGDGWSIIADEDTAYTFGFDYSPYGIPAAPNGSDTLGLKMEANIVEPGAAAAVSAYPNDLDLSGQYQVQFDFWLNYNSSGGTTEFGGASVGFDPSKGATLDGASFMGDTDGDSARDYSLYKNATELRIDMGDEAFYAIASQNNTDPALEAQFPGQTTPAAQGAAPFDPTNVIVTAPNGTLGYAWHTMTIDVDSDAGTARFAIDGFEIGTVDSNIGDPVNLTGPFALTFADFFSSVSTKPEFSFGVFDNVVVTQVPEPSSITLSLLALLGLCRYRRRR